jgi:hypothetical protein
MDSNSTNESDLSGMLERTDGNSPDGQSGISFSDSNSLLPKRSSQERWDDPNHDDDVDDFK